MAINSIELAEKLKSPDAKDYSDQAAEMIVKMANYIESIGDLYNLCTFNVNGVKCKTCKCPR